MENRRVWDEPPSLSKWLPSWRNQGHPGGQGRPLAPGLWRRVWLRGLGCFVQARALGGGQRLGGSLSELRYHDVILCRCCPVAAVQPSKWRTLTKQSMRCASMAWSTAAMYCRMPTCGSSSCMIPRGELATEGVLCCRLWPADVVF